MKISLNKIRYAHEHYGPDGLVDDGVEALLAKIGAQLGEVEGVVDLSDRFDSVLIAKVVSCQDHANADRLHVCMIDDGGKAQNVERDDKGHVQVVCGAPNVKEGLMVAWLPPGSIVPDSRGKEPFVLEARDLRGVKSNGMLASPKELGISDNHEGILEVDKDVAPGTPFDEAYRTKGDMVIDIENKMFTHRPDCFGVMGIIREIAGIEHKPFKSPDWYSLNPDLPKPESDELKLEIHNELPLLVPRFTAVAMSGIEVKPSPVWLQMYLNEMGIRPINNVVDYTNFWMLETGQPLHAYDYDKVKDRSSGDGAVIVVRNPRDNERLKLLNGKTIDPRQEAIVIATDKEAIGLGGVMGGVDTEVDTKTKNIILESASFDMYSIRRTSMAHGLFTDAVTRFNKGQSPLQALAVLLRTVRSLQDELGAKVVSQVIDINQMQGREWVHPPVPITAEFINARLGLDLSADDIKSLLENVEFKVNLSPEEEIGSQNDIRNTTYEIRITAPFWRTDIETREDIVEEVGRLYGYDKLPLTLPRRGIEPQIRNELLELKSTIRQQLAKSGANGLLTYSFVHGDLIDKAGQERGLAFQLSNALSPDLQYYRLSLLPSLLDKVRLNLKAGYNQLALFEMGKIHDRHSIDEQGIPYELDNLAFVVADNKPSRSGAAFYQARKFMEELARGLGYEVELVPINQHVSQVDQPFQIDRSAIIKFKDQDHGFGILGEFEPSVRRAFKLPEHSAGFELGIGAFLDHIGEREGYVPLPRFPKVTQDMTLQVPAELPFNKLHEAVLAKLEESKPAGAWLRLTCSGIFQKPEDQAHKNVTFNLRIASYERTLTDNEVSRLLDEVSASMGELGAQRV